MMMTKIICFVCNWKGQGCLVQSLTRAKKFVSTDFNRRDSEIYDSITSKDFRALKLRVGMVTILKLQKQLSWER